MPDTAPDFLTTDEACELLRVSKNTLLKLLSSGEIPGMRVGRSWRISRKELEERVRRGEQTRPTKNE